MSYIDEVAARDRTLPLHVQENLERRQEMATGGPADDNVSPESDDNGQPRMLYRTASGEARDHDGYSTGDERDYFERRGETLFVRFDLAKWWSTNAFALGRLAERSLHTDDDEAPTPSRQATYHLVETFVAESSAKAKSLPAWVMRLARALGAVASAKHKTLASTELRWALVVLAATSVAAIEAVDKALLDAKKEKP